MAEDLIAWDTCVIVDAIQKPDGRLSAIQPMLNRAEEQRLEIAVSTVSIAETLYLRDSAREGMPQAEQNRLIERWFDEPFVLKRNADVSVCTGAAQVSRSHGLLGADAIILSTAILLEVDALITYDKDMLRLNDKLGIKIATPSEWSQQMDLGLDDTR